MDPINGAPITLPSHISRPNHQLCGHIFGKGRTRFGLLKDNRTCELLKPITDVRGKREYEFYQNIWNSKDDQLKSFIPKFYGLVHVDKIPFIKIEDATNGLANPSNMDIKIGIITYDPEANSQKIQDEMSKNPWQEINGFRICGARIYDPMKDDNYTILDTKFTRQLKPEDIPNLLDLFLGSQLNPVTMRVNLCETYLSKLQLILNWFNTININHLKFISSSLLFIHSSDSNQIILKMIDFAHVFPNTPNTSGESQCKDDNYIFGLSKLINYFESLLSKLKEQQN